LITRNIDQAVEILKRDGMISIPTETVYGLAANAFKDHAVKKIFDLKKRPYFNPLIVHIKSIDFLSNIAIDIPKVAYTLAERFWPGPLTLVLNKHSDIPDRVTAGKKTVAVRVPDHPITQALLAKLEFPLAAPSANPFGSISPTCAEHVYNHFHDKLEMILDGGECLHGIESTIIGFENNQPILYRHGSIPIEEIERIAGKVLVSTNAVNKPDAPGMLSRHYAPQTQMYVTHNMADSIDRFSDSKIGILVFKEGILNDRIKHQEILSLSCNFSDEAKKLYAAMHRLDNPGLDVIIAEFLPDKDLGKSINDKLKRAAKK
jgi:L-threonylcarbamoyladenylate synthase